MRRFKSRYLLISLALVLCSAHSEARVKKERVSNKQVKSKPQKFYRIPAKAFKTILKDMNADSRLAMEEAILDLLVAVESKQVKKVKFAQLDKKFFSLFPVAHAAEGQCMYAGHWVNWGGEGTSCNRPSGVSSDGCEYLSHYKPDRVIRCNEDYYSVPGDRPVCAPYAYALKGHNEGAHPTEACTKVYKALRAEFLTGDKADFSTSIDDIKDASIDGVESDKLQKFLEGKPIGPGDAGFADGLDKLTAKCAALEEGSPEQYRACRAVFGVIEGEIESKLEIDLEREIASRDGYVPNEGSGFGPTGGPQYGTAQASRASAEASVEVTVDVHSPQVSRVAQVMASDNDRMVSGIVGLLGEVPDGDVADKPDEEPKEEPCVRYNELEGRHICQANLDDVHYVLRMVENDEGQKVARFFKSESDGDEGRSGPAGCYEEATEFSPRTKAKKGSNTDANNFKDQTNPNKCGNEFYFGYEGRTFEVQKSRGLSNVCKFDKKEGKRLKLKAKNFIPGVDPSVYSDDFNEKRFDKFMNPGFFRRAGRKVAQTAHSNFCFDSDSISMFEATNFLRSFNECKSNKLDFRPRHYSDGEVVDSTRDNWSAFNFLGPKVKYYLEMKKKPKDKRRGRWQGVQNRTEAFKGKKEGDVPRSTSEWLFGDFKSDCEASGDAYFNECFDSQSHFALARRTRDFCGPLKGVEPPGGGTEDTGGSSDGSDAET